MTAIDWDVKPEAKQRQLCRACVDQKANSIIYLLLKGDTPAKGLGQCTNCEITGVIYYAIIEDSQ